MGETMACPVKTCPKGQRLLQKTFDTVSKYPGHMGQCDQSAFSMLSMLNPEDMKDPAKAKKSGSGRVDKCCIERELGYSVCGKVKVDTEKKYKKCFEKKCKGDKTCTMQASFAAMMGDGLMGGEEKCKDYNEQQDSHCECVPEDKFDGRFRRAVHAFYKVFASEKLKEDGAVESGGARVIHDFLDKAVYKKFKKGDEVEIWSALLSTYSKKLPKKTPKKPAYDDILKDLGKEEGGGKGKGKASKVEDDDFELPSSADAESDE